MPFSRKADTPDVSKLDEREQGMVQRTKWFRDEGQGYFHEQSTRPQTLGYGLRDSPVALLAWIFEKLHDWTDNYPWTEDEVLTWVGIYYFSRAGPDASTFIYREASHSFSDSVKEVWAPVQCPVALAYFPKELSPLPASTLSSLGPIKQVSYFDRGGHFAVSWTSRRLVPSLTSDSKRRRMRDQKILQGISANFTAKMDRFRGSLPARVGTERRFSLRCLTLESRV
jgi:hypothetical protein